MPPGRPPKKQQIGPSQVLAATFEVGGKDMDDVTKRLQLIMLEQAEKALKEDSDKEQRALSFRKAMLDATKISEEKKKLRQARCAHTKIWGGTALVGQHDNFGGLVCLCQWCLRMFTKEDFENNPEFARLRPVSGVGSVHTGVQTEIAPR